METVDPRIRTAKVENPNCSGRLAAIQSDHEIGSTDRHYDSRFLGNHFNY